MNDKNNEEPAEKPVDHSEIVQRLKELKELRDRGILTEAEYEGKRKPLVDQL